MKTQMKKWKGALVVLMVILIANTSAQTQGESWGTTWGTPENDYYSIWENNNCSNNSICDDLNPQTTDTCLNGFCINSDSSTAYLSGEGITNGIGSLSSTGEFWFVRDFDYLYRYKNHVIDSITEFTTSYNAVIAAPNDTAYGVESGSSFDTLLIFNGTNVSKLTENNSALSGSQINNINLIGDSLFVNTENGINLYHNNSWTLFPSMPTSLPASFSAGAIALQAHNQEILFYNPAYHQIAKYSNAWTIYNDQNSSISSSNVQKVQFNNNGDIIATHLNGIDIFDGTNWTFITNSNITTYQSYSRVLITSSDNYWVISGTNIDYYDGSNWTFYNASSFVQKVQLDPFDNLVYNTNLSINCISNGSEFTLALDGHNINFAIDKNGKLLTMEEENNIEHFLTIRHLPSLQLIESFEDVVTGSDYPKSFYFYEDVVFIACSLSMSYLHVLETFEYPMSAVNDTAYILLNNAADIAVINNDNLNTGFILSENAPPLHGTLVLNPFNSDFTYTPNPGYIGPDSFTYSICNNTFSFCDTATVYINVDDFYVDANDDSYTIETNHILQANLALNDSISLPNFSFFNLLYGPFHGAVTIDSATGDFDYTTGLMYGPGFTQDTFVYQLCASPQAILCDTGWVYIDITPNTVIAVNDTFDIAFNTTLNQNQLGPNDTNSSPLGGYYPGVNPPLNGTLNFYASNAVIAYIPNTNYIGLDSFTYVICSNDLQLNCDTAWVFVNYAPIYLVAQNDTFDLYTGNNLIANWSVNDSTNYISSQTWLNASNPPVNGNVIDNGNGEFQYTPFTSFVGLDSFQYNYSNTGFSNIVMAWVYLNVLPLPVDSVWPGDANLDGIANNLDVLPIGIAHGSSGPLRPLATTNWNAQYAPHWTNFVAPSINYKHSDCDGNGTVNNLDLDVVNLNYGLTHSKGEGEKSGTGIPLYLEINPNTYLAGSTVTGTINLGDAIEQAEDVYGIAFTLDYDNTIIEENTMQIIFNNSWLAAPASDVSLAKDFWISNKVEVGHSKTDQMNGTGFGPIATIEFNIQENLAGKTDELISFPLELSFSNILAVDNQYQEIDINGKTDTLYAEQEVGIKDIPQLEVKVYPNPVEDQLMIQAADEIASIEILNVLGQLIVTHAEINANEVTIPMTGLINGVYLIRIKGSNQASANLRIIKK